MWRLFRSCLRLEAFLCLENGSRALLGHINSDGSSPPLLHPQRCAAGIRLGRSGDSGWRDLGADRPQERRHLAGDRGDDDRYFAGTLSRRYRPPTSSASESASARLPGIHAPAPASDDKAYSPSVPPQSSPSEQPSILA